MGPQVFKNSQTKLKLKNRELAEALGVSTRSIEEWRGGRNKIPRSVELALRYLLKSPY